LLAALATSFAAIVAVIGTLFVAIVNSRSARRIARDTARREFRLSAVRPYLVFLDRRIAQYGEIRAVGPSLAAALGNVATLGDKAAEGDKPTPQLQEAVRRLEEVKSALNRIKSGLSESKAVYNDAGLFAFIVSDQRVFDRVQEWLKKDRAVLDVIVASGVITAVPEALQRLGECASETFKEGVKLRIAVEEFMFENRGWLRRGSYFIWSRSRARLKKLMSNRVPTT
jgi:hypothetical protein